MNTFRVNIKYKAIYRHNTIVGNLKDVSTYIEWKKYLTALAMLK